MAHLHDDMARLGAAVDAPPPVRVFLRPIAPPTALGLAGFAGSTWITASWIAGWWGGYGSPTIFFPFVMFWGGLAQFVAGIYGFPARDTLATVIHPLWGSFYMSLGVIWLLTAVGTLNINTLTDHIPEIGAWMVILMIFTWICAIGAAARDAILCATLSTLGAGTTVAVAGLYTKHRSHGVMKAAAYFWMISSVLAAYRVAVYVWEENFGRSKLYPLFRTRKENHSQFVNHGYGEPGVKRGTPKSVHDHNSTHGLSKGGMRTAEDGLGRRSSITAVH